jgi:hypothetical protein
MKIQTKNAETQRGRAATKEGIFSGYRDLGE